MDLSQLRRGESARIRGVGGGGPLRIRLLEMGLTPGAVVKVGRVAPLGDPIELYVRGYALTLRASECKKITVVKIGE